MAFFQLFGRSNNQNTPQEPKQRSRTGRVLRYTMMPEILPRIRALGFHFGHFAYLIALVFSSARLIPQTHPVLNPVNIGRFSVRQVIAIAANNIEWSKKNIDQIGIFSAIVIGLIMIAIQAVLIAIYALLGAGTPANAGPLSGFFITDAPEQDLVNQTLNVIFGPDLGVFGPVGADFGISGNYDPIYSTIHQILSIYSLATMVIAVLIIVYYVITVVGEAAQTGTPFGKRFNSLWAPIRLVIALGLLVPLGSGLNTAQYMTLWIAKQGSGLANQAWYIFFDNVANRDPATYIVGNPRDYDLSEVVRKTFLAEVCMQAYNKQGTGNYVRKVVPASPSDEGFTVIWEAQSPVPDDRKKCGELTVDPSLSTTTHRGQGHGADVLNRLRDSELVPTADIYNLVRDVVLDEIIPAVDPLATEYVNYAVATGAPVGYVTTAATTTTPRGRTRRSVTTARAEGDPSWDIKSDLEALSESVSDSYTTGIESIYSASALANFQEKIANDRDKGWIYAGVWYIQIGRIIQQLEAPKTSAIPTLRLPDVASPEPPEAGPNWFERNFLGEEISIAEKEVNGAIGKIVAVLDKRSVDGDARRAARTGVGRPADTVEDTAYEACVGLDEDSDFGSRLKCSIFSILVPDELFAIKAGTSVDPMTSLISAGASIFERSFYMVLAGIMSDVAGGLLTNKVPVLSGVLDGMGNILVLIGLFGVGAGIVLYFIVPLLPFIFFFFAVLSWIMEIAEAVIAMPLWALAHLKIDGEGMPGQAAASGYYMLLAILLRPILMVTSLMIGYMIFIFGGYLLGMLFDPVLNVVAGENMNGLQMLVFVVVFTFLIYNIGMAAFKLVDTIPNGIMRWLQAGVQTFGSQAPDPVGNMQAAMVGAAVVGSQLAGGVSQGAKGFGQGMAKTRTYLMSDDQKEQMEDQQLERALRKKKARDEGLIP